MEPVISCFVFFYLFDFTVQMSLHQILKPGAVAAPVTAKEFILLYLFLVFDYSDLDTSRKAVRLW